MSAHEQDSCLGTVPCYRRFVDRLSPLIPEFNPRPVYMKRVRKERRMGWDFLSVIRFLLFKRP